MEKISSVCIIFLTALIAVQQIKADNCEQETSREEAQAVQECHKELGQSPAFECLHVCLLEKLGVIEQGKVVKSNWKTFVDKKFPQNVRQKLTALLIPCSNSYSAYRQNKRCDENDEFFRCYEDAVDSVCEEK